MQLLMAPFGTLMLGGFSDHKRNPATPRLLMERLHAHREMLEEPQKCLKTHGEVLSESCLANFQSASKFMSKINACY